MALRDYTESLWLDYGDGTLVRYVGKTRLTRLGSDMRITTVLQRQAVRPRSVRMKRTAVGIQFVKSRHQLDQHFAVERVETHSERFDGIHDSDDVGELVREIDRLDAYFSDESFNNE